MRPHCDLRHNQVLPVGWVRWSCCSIRSFSNSVLSLKFTIPSHSCFRRFINLNPGRFLLIRNRILLLNWFDLLQSTLVQSMFALVQWCVFKISELIWIIYLIWFESQPDPGRRWMSQSATTSRSSCDPPRRPCDPSGQWSSYRRRSSFSVTWSTLSSYILSKDGGCFRSASFTKRHHRSCPWLLTSSVSSAGLKLRPETRNRILTAKHRKNTIVSWARNRLLAEGRGFDSHRPPKYHRGITVRPWRRSRLKWS